MTDLEKLLGGGQPSVEFKPYSEWSAGQPVEDAVESRKKYADYLRETHISADAYTPDLEQEIQTGLYQSLVKDGAVKEGDEKGFRALTGPKDPASFYEKVQMLQSSIDANDPDWEAVATYDHLDRYVIGTEDEGNMRDQIDQARAAAEDVVNRRYDDVKRMMVYNGELPFAKVTNEDGEQEVIAGKKAQGMNLVDALKQSSKGGISLTDANAAKYNLEVPAGFSIPRYEIQRTHEAKAMIEKLAEEDNALRTQINGHSQRLAMDEFDDNDRAQWTMNRLGQDITDMFGYGIGKVMDVFGDSTMDDDVVKRRKQRSEELRHSMADVDLTAREVANRLNKSSAVPDAQAYSVEEVTKAYKQLILEDANKNNRFEFHEGENEIGKNIRTYGYGAPVVHPAAMVNEDTFNKMLAARPDIDDATKNYLRNSRDAYLTESFDNTDKILSRSGVSDEWHTALIDGRQKGKSNKEILNDFLKDENNFSEFKERAKGVAWSLWDSVTQLAAAIPAAAGVEWAQDTLVKSAQRNSDRRAVANLFGKDFGFGQDLAETIAPMLSDIAATTVLATVTAPAAGAGGAAYLAAKQGARFTAKGLLKALTSSTFRSLEKGITREAGLELIEKGLIKETGNITGEGAMAALKGYNSVVAQRIGAATASFIPAATRSGASTYGSVFHTLSSDPNNKLSREEIHDRALGAGLAAGAITGVITSAFGAFGKGGVEDALLKGMSYKEMKATLASLANVDDITDEVFKKVVKDQLVASVKKYRFAGAKGMFQDFVDEAEEEGIDQLMNGFVEDAALEKNTPMLERLQQSFYAAALGGVMGAGATPVRNVFNKVTTSTQIAKQNKASDAEKLRTQFINDVTERLNSSGSPLTAQAVRASLSTMARTRISTAPPAPAPTPVPADTTPADATPPAPALVLSEETRAAVAKARARLEKLQKPIAGETRSKQLKRLEQIATLQNNISEIEKADDPNAPTTYVTELSSQFFKDLQAKETELAKLKKPVSNETAGQRERRLRKYKSLSSEIERFIQSKGQAPPILLGPAQPKRSWQSYTQPKQRIVLGDATEFMALLDLPSKGEFSDKMRFNLIDYDIKSSDSTPVYAGSLEHLGQTYTYTPDSAKVENVTVRTQNFANLDFRSSLSSAKQSAITKQGGDIDQLADEEAKRLAFHLPQPEKEEPKSLIPYVPIKQEKRTRTFKLGASLEFDLSPFKSSETIQEDELAEALAVLKLGQQYGYPVRFGNGMRYGAISNKRMATKSNFLADVIFSYYPVLDKKAVASKSFSHYRPSSRKKTYFDPETNKTVKDTRMPMPIDTSGRGIFNNDPVLVAEMLAHGIPVYVPKGTKNINPAIKVRNSYVTDVQAPNVDGKGVMSVVETIEQVSLIDINSDRLFNIGKIPFYPEGVEIKVLPLGAGRINRTTGNIVTSANQITFGELLSDINNLLIDDANDRGSKDYKSVIGKELGDDLVEDFRDVAVQTACTEYLMLAHLFELRGTLLDSKSKLTVPSPDGLTVNPRKRSGVIEQLKSRLKGDQTLEEMAEYFLPLVTIREAARPSHTEVVIAFIDQHVLNNPQFAGNVMPSFKAVLGQSKSRYADQQKRRGILERNAAHISLSDQGIIADEIVQVDEAGDQIVDTGEGELSETSSVEIPSIESPSISTDLGSGVDPTGDLDGATMYALSKSVVEQAVSSIDEDPQLREALDDLAFQSIFPQPTAETARFVSGMSTLDLMSRIGIFMSKANHSTNTYILDFIKELEDGSYLSGLNLRNALRMSALTTRFDGDVTENKELIKEIQRQLSDAFGRKVSPSQAKNFLTATHKAMRRLNSRAHIRAGMRMNDRAANVQDIKRLGLESGDPKTVVAALQNIAKNSPNQSHRLVANLLLDDTSFVEKVNFIIGSSETDIAGEYVRMSDGSHSVFINVEKSNGRGLENVLLEEYVHAFLSDTLAKPESQLTAEQLAAKTRLTGLMKVIRQSYINKGEFNAVLEDGMANLDEFAANFLLSPDFQKFIKTMTPPTGQRGFFNRIIEGLMRLFRKITRANEKQYAQAFDDIVNLSKTTIRATAVPFNQQMASIAHEAHQIIRNVVDIPRVVEGGVEVTGPDAPAVEETPAEGGIVIAGEGRQNEIPDPEIKQRAEVSGNINSVIEEVAKDHPTPQAKAEFEDLMHFLKSRMPYGVRLFVDNEMDSVMVADVEGVHINLPMIHALMQGKDRLAQRALIDVLIHEEIGHFASLSALTKAEIQSVMDSMSDEDYAETARIYFANSPDKLQLALSNLASGDPDVVGDQKLILAEERLRQQLQKVTRGYTTEEDYEFWSSNPSLLAVLKRYFGAIINRWVAARRMRGSSSAMDSALFKVMQEMQAIQLGFARVPSTAFLDMDSPAEAVEQYIRIMGIDTLDDIEKLNDSIDRVGSFASSMLPLNTFKNLMNAAELEVSESRELVPSTKKAAKKVKHIDPLADFRFEHPDYYYDMADYDATYASYSVTLENILEFYNIPNIQDFKKFSTEDIVDRIGAQLQLTDNPNWGALRESLLYRLDYGDNELDDIQNEIELQGSTSLTGFSIPIEMYTKEFEEFDDEGNFLFNNTIVSARTPYHVFNEDNSIRSMLIDSLQGLMIMAHRGVDPSTQVPVTVFATTSDSDSDPSIKRMTTRERDSMLRRYADGTVSMNFNGKTILEPLSMDLDVQEIENKIRKGSDGGMDHNALVAAVKTCAKPDQEIDANISSYGMRVGVYAKPDPGSRMSRGSKLNSLDVSFRDNDRIHIDLLTSGSVENQARGSSFANDFMLALMANNQSIKAKSLDTLAAGSGNWLVNNIIVNSVFTKVLKPFFDEVGLSENTVTQIKGQIIEEKGSKMNGYYSWPSIGFTPDINSVETTVKGWDFGQWKKDNIQDRIKEVYRYEMNRPLPTDVQLKVQAAIDDAAEAVTADHAELLARLTSVSGKEFDLLYHMHQHPDSKHQSRVMGLWRNFGSSVNCEFSLEQGSDNMKAYAQVALGPVMQRNKVEDITEVVSEYRSAVKSIPDDEPDKKSKIESIKKRLNQKLIDEGTLDFKLFAPSPSSTSTLNGIDFSHVVQLLEMPMFEYGAYKAPKNWIERVTKGDLGQPVKRLLDHRDEFKRASAHLVEQFKTKMDKLITKAYGTPSAAIYDLISKAQGYVDGEILPEVTRKAIEDAHLNRVSAINGDPALSKADKAVQIKASRHQRDVDMTAAEDLAIDQIKQDRDDALNQISKTSPELAVHIISMRRNLIEPIQKKLIAAGIGGDLALKIDRTGGIYITRAYRMFNDPTYAERVRTDKQYQGVRDAAMKEFEKQLMDRHYQLAIEKGKSVADAQLDAAKALQDANSKATAGKTFAQEAMEAFLASYDGKGSPTPQAVNGYKTLENNLKQRKDLPKAIRDLLGEYGPEVGTDLIVRTFSTVSAIATQQTFLNNIATVGQQEGFMVDATTYAADPTKYAGWVEVRKGTSSNNDPLKHMYAPAELVNALDTVLGGSFLKDQATTAEKAVGEMAAIAQKLTGKAMAMKTLGSVGFYARNFLGNILFFGPAQGFIDMKGMVANTSASVWSTLKTPEQIDTKLAEYIGLGVAGDDINAQMLRELLNGKVTPDSLTAKLGDLIDQIKVAKKGSDLIAALEKKAGDLSASIDTGFKIAYFEHELEVLKRAKAAHPNSKIGKMSEYELKREAARKVKMTSQSHSQAIPLSKALAGSGFGLIFAPFIRFKMEVPRIVVNTYRLAREEIASDNPEIKRRGQIRFGAMTGMIGVLSSALPAALAALSGIGDDEDEALRKSMPTYLRGHTFWFIRHDDGGISSLDLTYLNPFSLLVDPVSRAIPKLLNGEFQQAASDIAKGLVFSAYLDDQILAGAVSDVSNNRNETTGKPIWIEGVDDTGDVILKSLSHIYGTAYQPRLLKDALEAKAAVGSGYNEFEDSPIGQLLDGMYPVKVHEVDLQKQYRRFVSDHALRYKLVNDNKFVMYGKEPMSDADIEEVYTKELDGKRKLNQELLRVARGFESLGISAAEQYNTLKESGVGKDRARLLFYGVMDRPEINKGFAEKLAERNLSERLIPLIRKRDEHNRYLMIEDPE